MIITKQIDPIIEYKGKVQRQLKCRTFLIVEYILGYPRENLQQPVEERVNSLRPRDPYMSR